ncbi:transcription-repair coupling factor [Eubacterium sp. AB3007]|uniref:transcription-repair coupling factor n=1 Tax=Eubacterium sp. AB3007 TaxID=1392487 RepID=UPI00068C3EE2|nr:transcription-repair coupling factor [Eubacterium sp. AB3007]
MKKGVTGISGVSESRSAFQIAEIIEQQKGKSLIIVPNEPRARRLADDLSFFTGRTIHVIPEDDQVFLRYEARNRDQMLRRISAMKALASEEDCIVVAPVTSAVKRTVPYAVFAGKEIHIRLGEEHFLLDIRNTLVELGYERVPMVEAKGEFSIRGGIVDIFVPDMDEPCRIEFFDTEVDSIRTFHLDTQRSLHALKEIVIGPAGQMPLDDRLFEEAAKRIRKAYTAQATRLLKKDADPEVVHTLEARRDELCEYIENKANLQILENYIQYFYDKPDHLWNYLGQGTVYVDDPARVMETLEARAKEMNDDFQVMLERGELIPQDHERIPGREDLQKAYAHRPLVLLSPFPRQIKGIEKYDDLLSVRSSQMMSFRGHMELLEQELTAYINKGYDITLTVSSQERKSNLVEFVDRMRGLSHVTFRFGSLSQGFVFQDRKLCYISDNDIFSEKKTRRKKVQKSNLGQTIDSFTDLKTGDYVVHESYGIGRFEGIQRPDVKGITSDYLKIRYAGSDVLYVPVEKFAVVQKYIGADGTIPKLNRLSGSEWKATKAKARRAIADMTEELVALYAAREAEPGYAFGEDTVWQKDFEDSFPYEETGDQLRCIEEIKADMEKPRPMDRLLCGDVGFGKTEVAARAIFKCISEGRQAAILVPTTVLANQHFYTLRDRFSDFPFHVEMLSRFRTGKQEKEIIEGLASGEVDLIIGTHRILSKDVVFKDLGLLVIDEEHRFGVKHKEAIKQLRKSVDVLTLSATPIPRTLNMSLTGIKDMSLIEEPPEERYPVQTYVMEEDDRVIREAISRELDRDGQCFVIYNRVNGISKVAEHIRQLVPEARVATGHGRMSEQALEDVMLSFVDHEIDVLVATTIVESGIDIPNANTLIVVDADRYGLAQLYQIRGRVGRSNRIAYAYLMYRREKVLSEVAEKRLRAIREFTEFGSGFKVAMRDLEIRGAGNLLGGEQSGHIMDIGYELYCKLVDEAVRRLKGELPPMDPEEEKPDISIELKVRAGIPDYYIENESQKLSMYRKISRIRREADAEEVLDELIDRFGDIPKETEDLIRISQIRALAEDLGVLRIYEQGNRILFTFGENNGLTPLAVVKLGDAFGGRAFFHGGVEPFIRIPLIPRQRITDSLKMLSIMEEAHVISENHHS